ncbi:hypothetical protein BJ912DRAFT_1105452 [Pholiota molesta]|nr:hypothetical protein BJ912DRAFT_1105452 [Pholiota molesta]
MLTQGHDAPLAAYCFMTGYMLAGLPRLSFHKADQQALCSLISFNLGAFVGRIGDKALFTMAAAIAFWKAGQPSISNARDDPAWTNTLTFVGVAFMSASLGVQGILGKRLNTQFGTTIVLTTVWRVMTRDHRLIAPSRFSSAPSPGAPSSRSGTAGTMGVAVGFRILITFSWIFVPGKAK